MENSSFIKSSIRSSASSRILELPAYMCRISVSCSSSALAAASMMSPSSAPEKLDNAFLTKSEGKTTSLTMINVVNNKLKSNINDDNKNDVLTKFLNLSFKTCLQDKESQKTASYKAAVIYFTGYRFVCKSIKKSAVDKLHKFVRKKHFR